MAAYGGHIHVVRLCHNYDKVNLDEVMEWAAEGGHEEVVHLCRDLGPPILTWLCYGPQVAVKKTSYVCIVIESVTNFDQSIAWATDAGHENILCDHVTNGEPLMSTRLWCVLHANFTNS